MAHQTFYVGPHSVRSSFSGVGIDPNRLLNSIMEDFDDLFEEPTRITSPIANPQKLFKFPICNVGVDKTDDSLLVQFALAGYSKDQLSINIEDEKLLIKATIAKDEAEESDEDEKDEKEPTQVFFFQGIKSKDFSIEYPIGSKYDGSKAKSTFIDGLLSITIPVAENKKPKTIEIA